MQMLAACAAMASSSAVPSIDDLSSIWIDPNAVISAAANISGDNRDLATINNCELHPRVCWMWMLHQS